MKRFIIGVAILSLAISYLTKSAPNALRITHEGLTTVIRYPHASGYRKGDMIQIDMDGHLVYAIVIEPVFLEEPTELDPQPAPADNTVIQPTSNAIQ